MNGVERRANQEILFGMEVSGDKMEKIFGSSFMHAASRNHLFYPRYPDNDHRTSRFSLQEVAKAVAAYNDYQHYVSAPEERRKGRIFTGAGLHGIIPQKVHDEIVNSSWWDDLCKRFARDSGCTLKLPDILLTFTCQTITKEKSTEEMPVRHNAGVEIFATKLGGGIDEATEEEEQTDEEIEED
jgi:hypothetical protein